MKRILSLRFLAALGLALTAFTSCKKESSLVAPDNMDAAQKAAAEFNNPKLSLNITFYALSGGVVLDKFSTSDPEKVINSVNITGLQSGETILAIDFRPATGQLYGISSTSRLYIINPETGMARMVGSGPITPAITGTLAGFDFNPTVDRIRLVTSSGQNLRINPETGAVTTDGNINGQSGAMISSVAYTNNFAGANSTTLYDIDVNSQMLFKQIPPNDGKLEPVGPLQLKVEGEGGFDISAEGNVALALYEVNKKSTLFTIDLQTGKTKILAKYEKSEMYTGIAIPTQPVAYALTSANQLLIFNPMNTSSLITKTITGLSAGESLVGLDMRPLNGQLFALSNTSRLYTINAASGMASPVGQLTILLSGSSFGFDFNPLVDRIRIVSNTGQNLRVNPADASAINDGALNGGNGMPMVTAAAYTNNFAGTTSTTLYDIDTQTDQLLIQNPPNNGTLVLVGSLGVNAEAANGFDIGGTSGIAYAILTTTGSTGLYRVNLSTGTAAFMSAFNTQVTGFTVGLGF
jgi:hypothetical protein